MGIDLRTLPEPDIRNVAKKLVRVEKPCVAELSTLMDCMKVRFGMQRDAAWVVFHDCFMFACEADAYVNSWGTW
jgi:hypothetical protein